jgi:hypothetical protein
MQPGVEHATIVRRLMLSDVLFLLEKNDTIVPAGLPQFVRAGKTDEAPSNDRDRFHCLEDIRVLLPRGRQGIGCLMPRDSLARVRALTKKLPSVEEGTTFGFPAFKVDGKLFAWFPKKKEVAPGSLGVRMSILERDYRIAANPSAYYVTPHYKDYDSVLVRVGELSDGALRELLESGHEYIVAKAKSPGPKRGRRR